MAGGLLLTLGVSYFYCLPGVLCLFFYKFKSLALKKKNYVGHPGLIKLEFLNIFVVIFLLLLYKLLEGKRNYDDFLSHVHFRLYFERVKQEMSTYD